MSKPTPSAQPQSAPEASVRETLESIVVAFVLAFVFRAFVVEAFVIPTGSMAPTLLGQHLRTTCPQCGYRYVTTHEQSSANEFIARDGRRYPTSVQTNVRLTCPMCEYPDWHERMRINAGDRILVLKYIYAVSEPQRWDVVVFKNPENPDENYIKRLVGLPNEELWIVRGDIYTQPLSGVAASGGESADEQPMRIERKPDDVQRAVWQPVYHSDYYPLDDGMTNNDGSRTQRWRMPWQPRGLTADRWKVNRNRWDYDDPQTRVGVLEFVYDEHTEVSHYAYNQGDSSRVYGDVYEDVRISATITPATAGLRSWLMCSSQRLWVRAWFEPDGQVWVQTQPTSDEDQPLQSLWQTVATGAIDPPTGGRPIKLELWHVDQSIAVFVNDRAVKLEVDGRLMDRYLYEHNVRSLVRSPLPRDPPVVQIGVQGAPVLVRSLGLDRDLYYTQTPGYSGFGTDQPAIIRADQFYCLGDNSPSSKDSRLWTDVNDWVRYVVRTNRDADCPVGIVPREMMIGRAFFVYFPAPWRMEPTSAGLIPNFGQMRFIH